MLYHGCAWGSFGHHRVVLLLISNMYSQDRVHMDEAMAFLFGSAASRYLDTLHVLLVSRPAWRSSRFASGETTRAGCSLALSRFATVITRFWGDIGAIAGS